MIEPGATNILEEEEETGELRGNQRVAAAAVPPVVVVRYPIQPFILSSYVEPLR